MFPILDYVEFNQGRTLQEEARLMSRLDRLTYEKLGEMVSEGVGIDRAQAEAETLARADIGEPYQWYEVDPSVVYPAGLAYIIQHYEDILTLSQKSEGELVGIVMDEKNSLQWLAGYVARARASTVQEILSIPLNDYQAGFIPYKELPKWEGKADIRYQVLEAVRHFVTEALHQTVNAPIGVHIQKVEDWKLI